MIKLGTLFWLILVSTTGFAMFAVKYEVQALEDELNRTKKATIAEEHAIHMDEAEWAYLTRPETLDEMNWRYLSLGPIATKQLRVSFTDIPVRAPAPVPVEAPAAAAVVADAPTESGPPNVSAAPIMPASLEKSTGVPDLLKPAGAKALGKPVIPRRPKSLDELIAQIAASR